MRTLLVEDNTMDADLARRALARVPGGIVIDCVTTLAQAREKLEREAAYELVLLDLGLPDGNGMELLLDIRARSLPVAVIVMTSMGDEHVALAALKAGADDYLAKSDALIDRLPGAVAAAAELARSDRTNRARRLRVLYAEHNVADVDLTRRHLERHAPNIALESVSNATDALARLPATGATPAAFDVLMLDYRLVPETGLDVLKEVREVRGLDLPVLMVTGQGGEDVAVAAMRLGATDYLVKHEGYVHVVPQALEGAHHRVMAQREQAALKASQERLSLVLRGTNDASWDVDIELGRVYLSPRWWEMIGLEYRTPWVSFEEAAGRLPPADRQAIRQRFADLLTSGVESFAVEFSLDHVDGRRIPVLARGIVLRGADGRPRRLAGATTDLTERKRAEAEIQALNATLERRVADRTHDLELANRELEAFTSSVSHDLRAPLRAIDALGALLQEQEAAALSVEGRRMLGLMRTSALRMAGLVDGLLRFARYAREPLNRGRVPMAALVQQCLNEQQSEIAARGIQVDVGPLPDDHADANLVQLVWSNLIGNAVKYTRKEPAPHIWIAARAEGAVMAYSVRDNGAGFDMAHADKLFKMFQRLHRADEFDGHGVGLATAARIIERHGGRIWAEGAPGRGATFHFTLCGPTRRN